MYTHKVLTLYTHKIETASNVFEQTLQLKGGDMKK